MKVKPFPDNKISLLLLVGTTALVLIALAQRAHAQTMSDGSTPSGAAPGAPVGSRNLSDIESINLFNGHLNMHVPIMGIGGRGHAMTAMNLAIDNQWTVKTTRNPSGSQPPYFYYPELENWPNLKPGYGPGVLVGRRGGEVNPYSSCGDVYDPYSDYSVALTRLTFILPNGTEYELRDQWTGGQPRAHVSNYPCHQTGANRGRYFISADGSAATFISDTDIIDAADNHSHGRFYPTGYLLLRDGARMRIEGGLIKTIRDRTGNTLTFSYVTTLGAEYGRLLSVVDPLNRVVTVSYDVTDVEPYGLCDQITFKGFGGADEIIRISKTNLHNALRAGQTIKTVTQLFQSSGGGGTVDPVVTSALWLPNGQRYKFLYDSYVELARVELPTGGAAEYDWGGFGEEGNDGLFSTYPDNGNSVIYRRVIERRVLTDGISRSEKTQYSNYEESAIPTGSSVTHVNHFDLEDHITSTQVHFFHGQVLESMVHKKPTEYSPWKDGHEYKTEFYAGGDYNAGSAPTTPLRVITKLWAQREHVDWWHTDYPTLSLDFEPPNDPRLIEVTTTINEPVLNESASVTWTQRFLYDRFNNQTDIFDDYIGRHTHIEYLAVNPQNGIDYTTTDIHLRDLSILQTVSAVTSSTTETVMAATETRYDESQYAPLTYATVTGWTDPETAARGNPTTTRTWLNASNGTTSIYPAGTYLESHIQYDQCGNARNLWDAKGKQASISYYDSFSDHQNRNTYTFPGQSSAPSIPDPYHAGAWITLTSSNEYDFSTGLVTSTTDANGQTINFNYNDPLNRVRQINRPGGGTTTYDYGDTPGNLYTRIRTTQNSTQTLESYECLDGLSRPSRGLHYRGDSTYETTDIRYDASGRVWKVSNPYLSSGLGSEVNPTGVWTTTLYDSLGRQTKVIGPDGSQVTMTYSTNNETECSVMTVTDPAGRSRRQLRDPMGRIKRVDEPDGSGDLGQVESPLRPTQYHYDRLDRLIEVSQYDPDWATNAQVRSFVYDSLGHLISVANPENGTITYQYDQNGNVTQRKDARQITATYSYDDLNRIVSRTYSDGTPAVTYGYDSPDLENGIGRLVTTSSSVATSTIGGYDAEGRAGSVTETIGSHSYSVLYAYDFTGNVVTQVYPSERTVHYTYDSAGRMNSMTGNLGDGTQRSYSTEMIYAPLGGLSKERFGTATPIYNKRFYNVRGQLAEIREGTTYTGPDDTSWNRGAIINFYGTCGGVCTDNNGNITKQEHWIPGDDNPQPATVQIEIVEYEYDWLNRVTRAHEGNSWQQRNIYDQYGNRTVDVDNTSAGLNPQAFEVERATNRLLAPGDSNLTGANINQRRIRYDAAGNMTHDSYTGSGQRTYDAENRLIAVQGGQAYSYDGDGARVKRTVNGLETWQIFGLGGELVAEYAANADHSNPQKEYGYRNGQLLITAGPPIVTGPAPSGLTAAPSNATVTLTWSPASGATRYRIERKDEGSGYAFLTASTTTSFADHDMDDDSAHLYRVCASDSQDNCTSGYSNAVLGVGSGFPVDPTIISINEDPSGVNVTTVKAEHIIALRFIVRSVRYLAGLPAPTWSYPNIAANGIIHVEDVRELRQKLNEALTVLNFPLPTYTDPTIKGYSEDPLNATPIKGAHIRELRLASTRATGAGGGGAGTSTPNIHWLVTDQLGTPRMIFDVTGSFGSVSRHDYLPFGEELFAGGRNPNNGYTNNDGARQKFTGKERDSETGLDYFGARYHSSIAGRFTTPDQPFADQDVGDPQSWNLYSYVRNHPLVFVDPLGRWILRSDDGDDIIFEAEPGDNDLSGIAECLGIPLQTLVAYFGPNGHKKLKPGDIFVFSRKAFKAWSDLERDSLFYPDRGDAVGPSDRETEDDQVGGIRLGWEWLSGTGPKRREFGPRAFATRQMMTSPDVAQHRLNFLKQGGGSYRDTVKFGWSAKDGPRVARGNWTRQAVGSFVITIQESRNGDAIFTITNRTSLNSALYDTPGVQNHQRSEMGVMGNTYQEFWWIERGLVKH